MHAGGGGGGGLVSVDHIMVFLGVPHDSNRVVVARYRACQKIWTEFVFDVV